MKKIFTAKYITYFMFLLVFSVPVFAKIVPPVLTDSCSNPGDTKSCPNISCITVNGHQWCPAQAPYCECKANGISGGTWSQCTYPAGGGFTETQGSCQAGNYKTRYCSFQSQTVSCNSTSVAPKYSCGSWTNGTCNTECTSGTTQNKYTASGCSYTTQIRKCCNGYWTEWASSTPSCPDLCGATSPEAIACTSCGFTWNVSACTCNCGTKYTWDGQYCRNENLVAVCK